MALFKSYGEKKKKGDDSETGIYIYILITITWVEIPVIIKY
jgi:hypothetical protein